MYAKMAGCYFRKIPIPIPNATNNKPKIILVAIVLSTLGLSAKFPIFIHALLVVKSPK